MYNVTYPTYHSLETNYTTSIFVDTLFNLSVDFGYDHRHKLTLSNFIITSLLSALLTPYLSSFSLLFSHPTYHRSLCSSHTLLVIVLSALLTPYLSSFSLLFSHPTYHHSLCSSHTLLVIVLSAPLTDCQRTWGTEDGIACQYESPSYSFHF